MRAVVQRVTKSSVTVDGQITGATDEGLVVLIGVEEGDTDKYHSLLCWEMYARANAPAL